MGLLAVSMKRSFLIYRFSYFTSRVTVLYHAISILIFCNRSKHHWIQQKSSLDWYMNTNTTKLSLQPFKEVMSGSCRGYALRYFIFSSWLAPRRVEWAAAQGPSFHGAFFVLFFLCPIGYWMSLKLKI